jgi:hypothetical protein
MFAVYPPAKCIASRQACCVFLLGRYVVKSHVGWPISAVNWFVQIIVVSDHNTANTLRPMSVPIFTNAKVNSMCTDAILGDVTVCPWAYSSKPFREWKYLYFQGQTAQTNVVTSEKSRLLYQHRCENLKFRNINVLARRLVVKIYASKKHTQTTWILKLKF